MTVEYGGYTIISTEEGGFKFAVSDQLEQYRVKTILTKEPETIKWIDSWGSHNLVSPYRFWDIGANIGVYTVYAAMKYTEQIQVLSIEPFSNNFTRLLTNISINGLWNVLPLCVALSDNCGPTMFLGEDNRFGASGNVVMDKSSSGANVEEIQHSRHFSVKETVLQITGNDLLKLKITPPNFIKIDVDGLELGIVNGMKDVLQNDSLRSVLIEVNSKDDLDSTMDIFSDYGLLPDNEFNNLEDHSRNRRSKDPKNSSENWVFSK